MTSLITGNDPPILTVRINKVTSNNPSVNSNIQHLTSDVLQVPCRQDMVVGDVLSMMDVSNNVVLVSCHKANGNFRTY